MDDATFRERFVDWMRRENLSAYYVARVMDVSVPTVRRWKEGTTAPMPVIQRFVMKQIEKHAENRGTEAARKFADLCQEEQRQILDRHVARANAETNTPRIVGGFEGSNEDSHE